MNSSETNPKDNSERVAVDLDGLRLDADRSRLSS